jgi:hypothetical protein
MIRQGVYAHRVLFSLENPTLSLALHFIMRNFGNTYCSKDTKSSNITIPARKAFIK